MSWAELFERAADCAMAEVQVRERLAEHRARRGGTDHGEAEEGDGA